MGNQIKANNVIWLDERVNNKENIKYQKYMRDNNTIELFVYTKLEDCLLKLKEISFQKTFIIISGSFSQKFFIEFEKIIGEIKICPEIIVFTSKEKFERIKKNIINLDNFSLFNMDLVYDKFSQVKKELERDDINISHYIPPNKFDENNNCFSFEYINASNDLILPLTFMEFMELPNKFDVFGFNKLLLYKYSQNIEMKELIEQLLMDPKTKIPLPILVKYWVRAYTLQTLFYKEMNYILEEKSSNEYDTFIRVLYYGLKKKILIPYVNTNLYRGALIKQEEIDYIEQSLKNKKRNLPGCICYNKAFLSSSLDLNVGLNFALRKKPKENEKRVLYIFKKCEDLDKENATNAVLENYSRYKKEREILFFPYSCFEITQINNSQIDNINYLKVYLSYLGEYKSVINKLDKIPENGFAKEILSSGALDKIEMNKEENKNKFDFKIDKYIPKEYIQSYILATYDITINDINKNIQILNCDENINKNEIQKICNIYLNDQKIDFTFEYEFKEPGKYVFHFEFDELLKNANKLFYNCNTLISLDFRKFKTNYLKDMTNMFNGCSKLEELDLSSFKTKDVISMKSAFKDCSSLKTIDLSTFDTKKVTDMSEMFRNCNSLTILNLSNFETEKVNSMSNMFYGCKSLFFINISKFVLNKDIKAENMFYDCPYFTNLKNEFISEITDNDISNFFQMAFNAHLLDEGKIISESIQIYLKNKKYENIEIIKQSMGDFINNTKKINISFLGESEQNKNNLITSIKSSDKFNELNLFNIGEENHIMEKEIQNVQNIIDNKNNKNQEFNFIWICIDGSSLNYYLKNILNKLNQKYLDKIPIFILCFSSIDNNNITKFKNDTLKLYQIKIIEIFQISLENNDSLNKIIMKMKEIFIKENIADIAKNKLDKVEIEHNVNDLPKTMANYFEKLLGKYDEINLYISKYLKTFLNYSKNKLKTNTVTNFINDFKQNKLKLKMEIIKRIDIENFNDELNKEIDNRYTKISQEFFDKKYDKEVFNFFKNYLKSEANNIIYQTIKDFKYEDLKPIFEKIWPNEYIN